MTGKIVRLAAAAVLAGAVVAPAARAEEAALEAETPRNLVSAVRVEREATQTVVRIGGSQVPVFSVYTLHRPLRLVIDIAQGDVSRLETPIEVDDGVVTKIVAAQYGEGKRAVGRVIVGFVRPVPYDVVARGNELLLRIAAVGKARPTAEAMIAKEAELARARDEAERAEQRRRALEAEQGTLVRRVEEKESELKKVREALEARTREVEETRAAAKVAEKRASDAAEARDAEARKRQILEEKLADAERALAAERESARKAEGDLAMLRKELEGSQGVRQALERTRADAARAAEAVAQMKREASALAEAEKRARAEAERNEVAARELVRVQGEARALAARLADAERRVREIEALRARVAQAKSKEAAARELLAHKGAELEALKARLAAAERLTSATAAELARVKAAHAERARAATRAREDALASARKAREARAHSAPVVAGEGNARISLAGSAAPPPAAPVVVKDVGYRADRGRSRLTLTVEGEPRYVVHRRGARRLLLDLPGARLPKHLRRKLDVSELDGPVAMVSAYESERPVRATRVLLDLRGPASYEVKRDGKDLRLEVIRPDPHSPERTVKARPVLAAGPAAADADDAEVLEEKTPPPETRRRPASKKRPAYRGRRINLDLQDAEIHTVLKLISEVIRLNFVVSDEVKGRVTMTLRDVPWDQALEIILKSKGIGYVREGNIIRVAPEKVLAKEAEEDAKRQVAVKEAQPILLKIIPVNYAKASDLQARIKDVLSDKGSVSVDVRTNRLIVRDVLQRIRAAERMVKKLDTQTPQVLIEARIVEANTTFSRDIGIQWGGDITLSPATGNPTGLVFPSTVGIAGGSPLGLSTAQGILNPAAPNFAVNLPAAVGPGAGGAVGFTFGSIGGNVNLNLRISAAEENGQAKIISAPKITTMDNQRATIQQGVSIPISQSSALGVNTIFVDANLTLTVTPHVTLDGSVIMDIIATKNEPDFTRTGAQGDPTILRKEARTQVLIKDGETTVIGGIYTRNVNTNFRQVPLFSRIPILGWLFKKKLESDSRTELLIFITPRIVNRPEALGT